MAKPSIFVIYLIAMMSFFLSPCHGFTDRDFQYWNTEGVSWQFHKDWKISLEEEFRFGNDGGDFYYQHSDAGIVWSGLAEWFQVGSNYRFIFEDNKGDWKYENRPHVNQSFTFNLCKLSFSNRNRFEYRDKEDGRDGWRYRSKFTVKAPKWTRFEIQPYIAEEIFVDFDAERLNRNRLSGGIALKLYKRLQGEIYYMWQSGKTREKWIDWNILGTKLRLSF